MPQDVKYLAYPQSSTPPGSVYVCVCGGGGGGGGGPGFEIGGCTMFLAPMHEGQVTYWPFFLSFFLPLIIELGMSL